MFLPYVDRGSKRTHTPKQLFYSVCVIILVNFDLRCTCCAHVVVAVRWKLNEYKSRKTGRQQYYYYYYCLRGATTMATRDRFTCTCKKAAATPVECIEISKNCFQTREIHQLIQFYKTSIVCDTVIYRVIKNTTTSSVHVRL